jgi:acylglycerol lipase
MDFQHIYEDIIDKKFVGTNEFGGLVLSREYIPTGEEQLEIYYSNFYKKEFEKEGSEPIASVCIIHGFGEHSGLFYELAMNFTLNNFDVHLVDLRSYGYDLF